MGWKCWVATGLILQMAAFIPGALNTLCPEPTRSEGHGVVIDFVAYVSKRDRIVIALGFALVSLGSLFQVVGLLRSP